MIDGLEVGGAQTVLLGMLRLGREHGLELYVANVGGRYDATVVGEIRAAAREIVLLSGGPLWDPRPLVALVQAIHRHDIDVVHTHLAGGDFVGGLAARLTGRPTVATLHSVYGGRARLRPARRRLANFATRRLADRAIAVSHAVEESFLAGLDLPPDRVRILASVPNGPRLAATHDRSLKRAELGLADGPVACTASRLTETRDHATLLRALAEVCRQHPTLTVLIVGDGPVAPELARLSRELGLQRAVRFLGTRHDALQIMAASDVFLHPTLLEGLGMAVLEAMSLGVPVAASRVPSIEELIRDNVSGLLVGPRDVAGWQAALLRLLSSVDLRRTLGQEGRRIVASRSDPDAWWRAIESIYLELAGGAPAHRRAGRGRGG